MVPHGHLRAIYAKSCVRDVKCTEEEDRTKELHSHSTISHVTQPNIAHFSS